MPSCPSTASAPPSPASPSILSAQRTLNASSAHLAGWIWVLYPFSIYFSANRVWDYALTSLLFATCFAIALCLGTRISLWPWLAFGLLSGLTLLSNPSVAFVLLLLLALSARNLGKRDGPWLRNSLVATLTLLAVVTPWTVRNFRVLHILCPVRDGLWLEFYAGNNGDTSESNPAWTHPASNPAQMHRFLTLGETAFLAEKHSLSLLYVQHHPLNFVTSSGRRALAFWTSFWSFTPKFLRHEPTAIPDFLQTSALTVFMLRGLLPLRRRKGVSALPYLLVIALFPLPYYLTHASPDYRQPIEPIVVVLVAAGVQALRPLRSTRTRGTQHLSPDGSANGADLPPATRFGRAPS